MTADQIRRWNRRAADGWRGRWRAPSTARMLRVFGVVLLFSSPLVSSFTLWRVEQQRCDSRKTSSSLIRSAIVVAVDEVGIYADVREPERGDLRDRVYARVIKEYPPPEC